MAKDMRDLTLNEIRAEETALTDFQFAVIDAMNERGISQSELANIIGVSRARISQLLSPESNPTLKLVGRVCAALGIKATYGSIPEPDERRSDDFWEVFINRVNAVQTGSHYFTADQVSIFKSRARIRSSLWDAKEVSDKNSGEAQYRVCAA